MSCCKKYDRMPERSEADVYRSLIDGKVKQLDWALGEIKRVQGLLDEADGVIEASATADSIADHHWASACARSFLAKLRASKEAV